ncbi:MAG: putative single-stranded DNA-binding protein [Prokaryotic dsDNA virus sp.]|nr:MAG: putative single-stranded DNA-binding protein [Prokaryotic dsDNA virus sp.]|tara:strand:+ start:32510 stop:32905 length:396 start_codon:yes stop_codon:yes gene_type:complete
MSKVNMNSISLCGNLARDPEAQQVKTGNGDNIALVKFTIANNRLHKREETCSFFDCEIWGASANFVNDYCRKGDKLAVNGEIRIDKWEDKDGNPRSKPIIKVKEVELIQKKDKQATASTAPVSVPSKDIPF